MTIGKGYLRAKVKAGNQHGGRKIIPMIGKRFGKLKVIGYAGRDHRNRILYHCQCDCGEYARYVRGSNLRDGYVTSCGCVRRENMKKLGKKWGPINLKNQKGGDDAKIKPSVV